MWTILMTDDFIKWWRQLPLQQREALDQKLRLLARTGPNLGRPTVDTIRSSALSNLKELRTGTIRVLFAFDPTRSAVLLLGGDKRHRWNLWYDQAIPAAERIYARHLAELDLRDVDNGPTQLPRAAGRT